MNPSDQNDLSQNELNKLLLSISTRDKFIDVMTGPTHTATMLLRKSLKDVPTTGILYDTVVTRMRELVWNHGQVEDLAMDIALNVVSKCLRLFQRRRGDGGNAYEELVSDHVSPSDRETERGLLEYPVDFEEEEVVVAVPFGTDEHVQRDIERERTAQLKLSVREKEVVLQQYKATGKAREAEAKAEETKAVQLTAQEKAKEGQEIAKARQAEAKAEETKAVQLTAQEKEKTKQLLLQYALQNKIKPENLSMVVEQLAFPGQDDGSEEKSSDSQKI